MAGVLAIEDKSSIKYFFVPPKQQNMGLGFKSTEPPGCFNGLHFQSMVNHHP
jgi:hypothetical protein